MLRHPDKRDSPHGLPSALFNERRGRDYVLKHRADTPYEGNKYSLCFGVLRSLSVATRWRLLFILVSQLTWLFFDVMIYTAPKGAIQPLLAVHTWSIKPELLH